MTATKQVEHAAGDSSTPRSTELLSDQGLAKQMDESHPAPSGNVPVSTQQNALAVIAEKLRRAGATLPAPEHTGTSEGAIKTGLSIALCLVEFEAKALAAAAQPAERGYALLGIGHYVINHTAAHEPAELMVSHATDADKAGREVGDDRSNPQGHMTQPETMAVRLGFENVAGLDALEKQLRYLRAVHFPESAAALPILCGSHTCAGEGKALIPLAKHQADIERLLIERNTEQAARRAAQESLEKFREQCLRVETENQQLRGEVERLRAAVEPIEPPSADEGTLSMRWRQQGDGRYAVDLTVHHLRDEQQAGAAMVHLQRLLCGGEILAAASH